MCLVERQATHAHFLHCNGQSLLLCSSLDIVPKLDLMNPKNCQHHFYCWRLSFGRFFGRRYRMFPFETLAFALQRYKALFAYCAEGLLLTSLPDKPSAHKSRITARYYPSVHMERWAAMLIWLRHNWPFKVETALHWRWESMLAASLATSSADNTTTFKKLYIAYTS
jgi:hypothetical protein